MEGRRGYKEELDSFFVDMFGLKPQGYRQHPPSSVLRAYIAGELADGNRFYDRAMWERFEEGGLKDWQLSEVSLHVITCPVCAEELAALRAAQEEGVKGWWRKPLRERRVVLSRSWAYVAIGGGSIALLLFLLNLLLTTIGLAHGGGAGGKFM